MAKTSTEGGEKQCTLCSEWKALSEFYCRSRGGHFSQCKVCQRGNTKRWIESNKERHTETKRRKHLMDKYGITLEQYDEMFEDQDGKCAICLKTVDSMNLCVDHCHKTGVVRGLLCHNCNRGIGLLQDSADTLRVAADYLERRFAA